MCQPARDLAAGMCCACPVTSEPVNDFNALPLNWASDQELLAGLTVDDDDEHDDPVLRYADGRWPHHLGSAHVELRIEHLLTTKRKPAN